MANSMMKLFKKMLPFTRHHQRQPEIVRFGEPYIANAESTTPSVVESIPLTDEEIPLLVLVVPADSSGRYRFTVNVHWKRHPSYYDLADLQLAIRRDHPTGEIVAHFHETCYLESENSVWQDVTLDDSHQVLYLTARSQRASAILSAFPSWTAAGPYKS